MRALPPNAHQRTVAQLAREVWRLEVRDLRSLRSLKTEAYKHKCFPNSFQNFKSGIESLRDFVSLIGPILDFRYATVPDDLDDNAYIDLGKAYSEVLTTGL